MQKYIGPMVAAGIQPVHENCMNYGGMGWPYAVELLENVPGLKWVFDTANPIFNADRSRFKEDGFDWNTPPVDSGAPLSQDYGVIEKLTSEDVYMSHNWNGASMRARLEVPTIKYVYPKEGLVAWADNVVLLKDAQNVEEAKAFMNFIMHPENAALISNFARYGNAIEGSEQYMDEVMATAPEIIGYEGMGPTQFIPTCPQEVTELYTKIWNNLLK